MIDLETFKTKLSNEISFIPKRGGRKYKHYTEYKVQLKQHTLCWIKNVYAHMEPYLASNLPHLTCQHQRH